MLIRIRGPTHLYRKSSFRSAHAITSKVPALETVPSMVVPLPTIHIRPVWKKERHYSPNHRPLNHPLIRARCRCRLDRLQVDLQNVTSPIVPVPTAAIQIWTIHHRRAARVPLHRLPLRSKRWVKKLNHPPKRPLRRRCRQPNERNEVLLTPNSHRRPRLPRHQLRLQS